jgi:hypothetical protein
LKKNENKDDQGKGDFRERSQQNNPAAAAGHPEGTEQNPGEVR